MTAARSGGRLSHVGREPLVHFLLGGMLVFLLFAVRDAAGYGGGDIVVSRQVDAQLADQWQRAQGRMPDSKERKRLVEQWVREEILYREALRLGFDRDDPVIRRRLVNKMEFFLDTTIDDVQPSREDLESWLADNADRYRQGGHVDFLQLWYPGEADAYEALGKVKAGADWRTLGREISLPGALHDQSDQQVLKRFGNRFSREIGPIAADGSWHGPIASSFGYHLVKVLKRSPGRLSALDQVREEVAADWRAAERNRQLESAYATYRDQYDVVMPR